MAYLASVLTTSSQTGTENGIVHYDRPEIFISIFAAVLGYYWYLNFSERSTRGSILISNQIQISI